jgi:hypothetical protein
LAKIYFHVFAKSFATIGNVEFCKELQERNSKMAKSRQRSSAKFLSQNVRNARKLGVFAKAWTIYVSTIMQ